MSVPSLLSIFGNSGEDDPVYVDDVFSTFVYRGTGSAQSINNGIDLAGEGGLTWIKCRNGTENNILVDTERGVAKALISNSSGGVYSSINTVTAFNSNGFTIGANGATGSNNLDYVSWSFRKQKGFFDVVTYTDGGGGSAAIPHSLGSVPGAMMVKSLSSGAWQFYHKDMDSSSPQNYSMQLNETSAPGTTAVWNNTAPTSTHFSVGNNLYENGNSYVAYLFADSEASFGTDGDESIIKCGSYAGGTSPLQVDLGFEPQWILTKMISSSKEWLIHDSIRQIHEELFPNYAFPEATENTYNLSSTGLSLGSGSQVQGSGNDYVYIAIRRQHKPPEVATEVFAMDTGSTASATPTFDSGFVVDMAIEDNRFQSRNMGSKTIYTYLGDRGESSEGNTSWDSNLGWGLNYNTSTLAYMFRRAPGFMDVVNYIGNDAAGRNIPHNLEAVPELMLVKVRDTSNASYSYWATYYKSSTAGGATKYLKLDVDDGETTHSTTPWNGTDPTSTHFSVYTSWAVNRGTYNYVATLFATLPGISKVGTYSGTGNAINIDCGFTNGARFVMIKRTNGTGHWFYWDTVGGINSGTEPYRRFDRPAGQATGSDYINPLSAGFTVNASTHAGTNTSGNTYLFLAIA